MRNCIIIVTGTSSNTARDCKSRDTADIHHKSRNLLTRAWRRYQAQLSGPLLCFSHQHATTYSLVSWSSRVCTRTQKGWRRGWGKRTLLSTNRQCFRSRTEGGTSCSRSDSVPRTRRTPRSPWRGSWLSCADYDRYSSASKFFRQINITCVYPMSHA